MPLRSLTRPKASAIFTAAAALVFSLTACGTGSPSGAPGSGTAPSTAAPGLPSSHIHGLHVDAGTGQVLLATHEGLFDVTNSPGAKIGGTNDLMGFTAGGKRDEYYASGHPGPGSDLPNPLGLIRSVDGGRTWEPLSRQGESDFHALTVAKSGIVGYDGTLRTSPDGKTWATAPVEFVPAVLAASPEADTVLATTREGVQRSIDGGKTWQLNTAAPVIQFAAFATATEVVGIEPDGSVHRSADAGSTWSRSGKVEDQVQALTAAQGAEGKLWIWVAGTNGLVVSDDGGATFRPADAG